MDKKKPFSTLAEDLKKIRKRPFTPEEIERVNKALNPSNAKTKRKPIYKTRNSTMC